MKVEIQENVLYFPSNELKIKFISNHSLYSHKVVGYQANRQKLINYKLNKFYFLASITMVLLKKTPKGIQIEAGFK